MEMRGHLGRDVHMYMTYDDLWYTWHDGIVNLTYFMRVSYQVEPMQVAGVWGDKPRVWYEKSLCSIVKNMQIFEVIPESASCNTIIGPYQDNVLVIHLVIWRKMMKIYINNDILYINLDIIAGNTLSTTIITRSLKIYCFCEMWQINMDQWEFIDL